MNELDRGELRALSDLVKQRTVVGIPAAVAVSKMWLAVEATTLIDEHGGDRLVWGEHPDYPVADWQLEVREDNTRLGYWEWVANGLDQVANDPDNGG